MLHSTWMKNKRKRSRRGRRGKRDEERERETDTERREREREEREERGTEPAGMVPLCVCNRGRRQMSEEEEREREDGCEMGRKRETATKHVEIRGTLRPEQRHENLVRPPCLPTDHIPSPPDFLIREPYPPGCFVLLRFIRVRVYIDSWIIEPGLRLTVAAALFGLNGMLIKRERPAREGILFHGYGGVEHLGKGFPLMPPHAATGRPDVR